MQIAKQREVDHFEISLDLGRLDGVLWLLIRSFGGEIPEAERAKDEHIIGCVQFIHRVLGRIIEEANETLGSEFHTAAKDARSLAAAVDAMAWADGMLAGSDLVMVELFDAIDSCHQRMAAAFKVATAEGVEEIADAGVKRALQPADRRAAVPPEARRARAAILETI